LVASKARNLSAITSSTQVAVTLAAICSVCCSGTYHETREESHLTAESVLSHLEKVQQLPIEVQVGIARRIESCIKIARAAKNEAVVANIASSAMEEQAKVIGHGTMDPQWGRTGNY
jgi:hypothetical protein